VVPVILAIALSVSCRKPSPTGGIAETDQFSIDPATLARPPWSELGFVPADAEAVVRVDLAALAGSDDHARMIAFLLRAQQPAVWEFLGTAGIEIGKDLRAMYLVLGARRTTTANTGAFLLAGVGTVSSDRVGLALRHAGGQAEPAQQGSALYVWHKAARDRVGAAEPQQGTGDMDAAIGVAEGLLLLGTPDLVRRALAVRAGESQGVVSDGKGNALAREIAAMDLGGVAWGVAHSKEDDAYLSSVAPGLRRARFHAPRAPALEGQGQPPIELRVEFAQPGQADVFRGRLGALLASAAALAVNTPLGTFLAKVKDGATIRVEGAVVTATATL
jgi:hypothetical protein